MTARKTISKKRTKLPQAQGGIYFDFEGQTDQDPVLLGFAYDTGAHPTPALTVVQIVTDQEFSRFDDAVPGRRLNMTLADACNHIIDLSDRMEQPLLSWSEHDPDILNRITNDRSYRFRNARMEAGRWRKRQRRAGSIDDDPAIPNKLSHFEHLLGYERPLERHDVGDSIAYMRGLKSVSQGGVDRWTNLLDHNRHDLFAMRSVLLEVTGGDGSSVSVTNR